MCRMAACGLCCVQPLARLDCPVPSNDRAYALAGGSRVRRLRHIARSRARAPTSMREHANCAGVRAHACARARVRASTSTGVEGNGCCWLRSPPRRCQDVGAHCGMVGCGCGHVCYVKVLEAVAEPGVPPSSCTDMPSPG